MEFRVNIFGWNDRRTDRAPKEARWYGPGEPAYIGNWIIADGMVYAGSSIADRKGVSNVISDGCGIDPDLPVASTDADRIGSQMWYWPRYDEIDPRCRLAYLQWLSSGKCDPHVGIGYVFLYFYGIERRVFVEGSASATELGALTSEVERLLQIYGSNRSFHAYASEFLQTVALLHKLATSQAFAPVLDPQPHRGLTAETKVAVGQMIAHGRAIPFEWMMAWWLQDTSTRLRVGAARCFDEFVALVRARFTMRYPNGIRLEAPSSKLELIYRGASAAVRKDLSDLIPETLPDIEAIRSPVEQFSKLAERAMDDLSPLARLVGKQPERGASLQAAALLPHDCNPPWLSAQLAPLRNLVEQACHVGAPVKFAALAECSGTPAVGKFTRATLSTIASLLARLGVGIEPDPLYGRVAASGDDTAFLFRAIGEVRKEPDDVYGLALAMTTLIAGIASSSETGLGAPERRFMKWISNQLNLPQEPRQRLEVHLDWLVSKRVDFSHIRRLLRGVPTKEKATIAGLSVLVANADGILEPSEMQFLEKLFDELGITRQHLYGVIHQLTETVRGPCTEPVEVQQGKGPQGYAIPRPETRSPRESGPGLDQRVIEKIMAETRDVADILGGIFAGDDDSAEEEDLYEGLDRAHKTLLEGLLHRESWLRSEVELLAQACDLMVDGALDTINEWAFENFGEAILENGSQVLVYRDVIVANDGVET